jgi:hypothetical protein
LLFLVIVLYVQMICHIGLCERIIGTTYCAICNISGNAFNFFITKMDTSDGKDNGHVTRKLQTAGPLIITSDVHSQFACHCYTYTSDGQSARH